LVQRKCELKEDTYFVNN